MRDLRDEVAGDSEQVRRRLWIVMAAGLVVWLLSVWYATAVTMAGTDPDELVGVAAWGVAIVFGGLFLVYTWTVLTAIIEGERLRSTVARGLSLADHCPRRGGPHHQDRRRSRLTLSREPHR
jgi:hypothetical protein